MEIESGFHHPPLRVTPKTLEDHFRSPVGRARAPLRNPHHEPKVDAAARRRAVPAAVLIPIVERGADLTLLLTRRHHSISYPGHICFPGGRSEPGDVDAEDTALREAEEETALDRGRVRVIGRLGEYVSHSGFRITPVAGLVTPPLELVPRAGEVEEILEIPLQHVLDSSSYGLRRAPTAEPRAHFYLSYEGAVITGPTVSLLMGFYEELLKTHRPAEPG